MSGGLERSRQGGAAWLAKIGRPNGNACNNAADTEAIMEENSSASPLPSTPLHSTPLISSLQGAGSTVCEANAISFMCNFSKKIIFGLSAKLMGRPCSPCPPCNNWALDRLLEVIKIANSVRVEGGLALSPVAPNRSFSSTCPATAPFFSQSLSNALPMPLALDNSPSFGVTNIVASWLPSVQPLEATATTQVPLQSDCSGK